MSLLQLIFLFQFHFYSIVFSDTLPSQYNDKYHKPCNSSAQYNRLQKLLSFPPVYLTKIKTGLFYSFFSYSSRSSFSSLSMLVIQWEARSWYPSCPMSRMLIILARIYSAQILRFTATQQLLKHLSRQSMWLTVAVMKSRLWLRAVQEVGNCCCFGMMHLLLVVP